MDIKEGIKEGVGFIVGIPVDAGNFVGNITQLGYSFLTGKTINQPFNLKVDVNNIVEKTTGHKLYDNIPTEKDLKNPKAITRIYLQSANKNDNEGMKTTLGLVKDDPKTAIPLVQTIKEDFYNRMQAVIDGKAKPEDSVIAVRQLNQLLELAGDKRYAPYLQGIISLNTMINNKFFLEKFPELRTVKANFEKYNTLNKYLDYVDMASGVAWGVGSVAKKFALTPLKKVVISAVQSSGAITPLVSGVVRANVNEEGYLQAVNPVDAYFSLDAFKGVKELGKLRYQSAVYDTIQKLKSPDFNPSVEIAENLSKNYKLTNADLENVKSAVMLSNNKEISKFDTFMQSISKGLGEAQTVLWTKLFSAKNIEEGMLKEDRLYVDAFLSHEPVVELINKYKNKEGKIVIEDVNKLEEELSELAEKDMVVKNFMKYNRQRKVISELTKAIEEGNSEVALSIHNPANRDKSIDKIYSLNMPLKSIIDEVEGVFGNGDVISLTYKNRKGDTISRVVKSYYVPSNDEFRIVKGRFQYLQDGKWSDVIEDKFNIPLSMTHNIDEAIRSIAKQNGYDDVRVLDAIYMKPSTDVFPHKLEAMANRILKFEESLLKSKGKVDERQLKDFQRIVERAYNKGFLPKVFEKDGEKFVYDIDDYLKEEPQDVLKTIKDNMKSFAKNIIDRNKETSKLVEGYVIDEGSSFLKMMQNELKHLEEFAKDPNFKYDLYASAKGFNLFGKGMLKDVKGINNQINSDIRDLRSLLNYFITSKQIGVSDINRLSNAVDKSAKLFNATADLLKYLANTPYQDMKREGSGFAKMFDNYDSFKAYATLKYLQPTFANMKSVPFLHKFLDELKEIEIKNPNGLNPTQKLVKNFLNLYLNRDDSNIAKAHRLVGNLLTMLNPSIALGNFVAGFQSLHVLFPSLDIAKIGEVKKEFNKEMKKMIYTEGMYKYNILNPTFVGTEALLRSHVVANVKNDEIFNNVINDYAKLLGIKDGDVIKSLKETYINRREEFAEDLVDYITGLDARALQTYAIEFGKIGENIMPWYRFIFTPFSIAVDTVRNFRDAPEYIQRLGVGKAIGKPLALSTFFAIALGSQAVPFLAPVESPYASAKSLINTFALLFGEDNLISDKNVAQLVLKELDYNVLKSGLFDPNEKINFYTSFGSALLQAIAGAEAQGWDTNPFIHSLRAGLDFVSKIGASGVISPSAVSYTAEIPFPAVSIVQNIARKTLFATDDLSKMNRSLIAIMQSIPLTNNIYKEIAGKSLVRGVGENGKEDIWQPSLPAEIVSKEGQGALGLLHLIGFMLLNADAVLNGGELQKMHDLFKYELATDKERKDMFSPVKNPEGVDYYKLLNFKDYSVFYKLPTEDIIATLKYIPENQMPEVKERASKLMAKSLSKTFEKINQTNYTTAEVEELRNRYVALQNFLITADYLNWFDGDDKTLNTLRQINKALYPILKEKGIDVDYNDIIRVKRKLSENGKIGA
jgi:LysM repeat protein/antitoxin component HigA of HigAB toxin-antitoxin module